MMLHLLCKQWLPSEKKTAFNKSLYEQKGYNSRQFMARFLWYKEYNSLLLSRHFSKPPTIYRGENSAVSVIANCVSIKQDNIRSHKINYGHNFCKCCDASTPVDDNRSSKLALFSETVCYAQYSKV